MCLRQHYDILTYLPLKWFNFTCFMKLSKFLYNFHKKYIILKFNNSKITTTFTSLFDDESEKLALFNGKRTILNCKI